MVQTQAIDYKCLKVIDGDFEVEFEIEICSDDDLDKVIDDHSCYGQIKSGLERVDDGISRSQRKVDELNKEIEVLTNQADEIDYIIAVSCGLFSGFIDSLWVGEFDFKRGKDWSNKTVNEFVMEVAKSQGYQGERLDGAIKFLEDKYKVPSDNVWKGKSVGISAKSHHLDDLSHHPTPIGLFFSILTQFTKTGYFQNSEGVFLPITIDENGKDLIGSDIPTKIFCGTVNWFFHLVSDMSGSNKTAGVGMGIPGPIVSLLKEFSLIPGLNETGLAKKLKEIFEKDKFDLRSELALAHELSRQAVPVIINEVLVRAFYFISRLHSELKEKKHFQLVEWDNTLPWNNRTIVRMLTIATGVFTTTDLADAAIRARVASCANPKEFASKFILRVNFVGIARFAIALKADITMGIKREGFRNERIRVLSQQLHLFNAKVFYSQADMWLAAESTEQTISEASQLMLKTAQIFAIAWEDNKKSIQSIGEACKKIENKNPGLTDEMLDILKWG